MMSNSNSNVRELRGAARVATGVANRNRVALAFERGLSVESVAELTGLSVATVRAHWPAPLVVKSSQKAIGANNRKRVALCHASGMSISDTVTALNLSDTTVRAHWPEPLPKGSFRQRQGAANYSRVQDARLNGHSVEDVVVMTGLDISTVRRHWLTPVERAAAAAAKAEQDKANALIRVRSAYDHGLSLEDATVATGLAPDIVAACWPVRPAGVNLLSELRNTLKPEVL